MTNSRLPQPSDNLNKAVEDFYHHQLVCQFCGETWWGLHCPHDGYQNPCPNCDVPPTPLKGNCTCELVMPVKTAQDIINNEKIEAVKDALTKSEEAKQPSVSKPLTLDRLKNLVGRNLRKNEPDYGRRQFVMGYNQAKDEIRERILTW